MIRDHFLGAQQGAQGLVGLSLGAYLQREPLTGGNLAFPRLGVGRIDVEDSFEGLARGVEVSGLQKLCSRASPSIPLQGLGC